jgi:mRNA-degrading endonuclease toxin of MazEF toxin-antitoxin module
MKDFDRWNEAKKNVDNRPLPFFFKESHIYWAVLGVNVGKEINGGSHNFTRPVVVLKKLNKHTCLIVPLTKTKNESNFIRRIVLDGEIQKINMGQIRVISSKRLATLVAKINKNLFELIQRDLVEFYFKNIPLAESSRSLRGSDLNVP